MNNNYYTLITGASEGFGKAMAIECARRKMNLVLVALPGIELHNLAELIRQSYPVNVVCIEKDLCMDESCIELFNEVNGLGLKVNMLFNNAGIGSTGLFRDGNIKVYESQIRLNVLATTLITHLFLDMLKQNSPSYILNVGSLASFFSVPKKQVYGATKSFIYYFSKSLRTELKKDKIYVSVLCPGGMSTNMAVKILNNSGNYLLRLSIMNPEIVVPVAIDGLLKKKEVIVPGRLNKLFLILDPLVPGFIKTKIMNYGMKKFKDDIRLASLSKNQWQNSTINSWTGMLKDNNNN